MFQATAVPRDAQGYVKSFVIEDLNSAQANEARQFFEEYGFVVIANVFTDEQCEETISDIWNVIESRIGEKVRDDETLWTSKLWGKTGIVQEGIIGSASLWTRQILLNRQTPALHRAFSAILGTEDLLVNHDRYGMFRPAQQHQDRLTMTNLHLDMNPWNYIEDQDNSFQIDILSSLTYKSDNDWIIENNEPGCAAVGELHVQGLVNLVDNLEEDGGFWLVPGFHKHLTQWAEQTPSLQKRFGQHNRFILLGRADIPELYSAACHISTRAGSAIIWDQRTLHGSRANNSFRPRYAQFFKMFPRQHPAMTPQREEHRREAIRRKLQKESVHPQTDLTGLGRELFGLAQSLE